MARKVIDILPPQKTEEAVMPVLPKISRRREPEAKPKITYIPRRTEAAPGAQKDKTAGGFFGKRSAASKQQTGEQKRPSSIIGFVAKTVFVLTLMYLAVFLADMKLAKATIAIWPKTDTLTSETLITVDTNANQADVQRGVIPGKTITAEKTYSEEFPATGSKNNQNKAGGVIKIYNNFTSPQRLVKGTRFQSPVEKFQPALAKDETPWFRTTTDVILPAKSSADVRVVADGAGEKYNIEPSIFSIPGLVGTPQYTFVYGQSFEKFAGGEKGDVLEVRQEDIDAAKDLMAKKAAESIKNELTAATPGSFVLVNETVKIDTEENAPSVSAGAVSDKFSYQTKVKASGVIFDKSILYSVGNTLLSSKLPEGKEIYEPSTMVNYAYRAPGEGQPAGAVPLLVKAAAETYLPVNELDLKRGLSEKKISEAKFFLMNQPNVKNVQITPSPFWRTRIPKNLDRIEISENFE